MSERERLAFLSGAETMAEEIAKAVEQSEYQWAAHYAAFIRALPLLKPDEAALLRASAPPADVAVLVAELRRIIVNLPGFNIPETRAICQAADALAALATENACRRVVATCWERLPLKVAERTAHRLHDMLDDWPKEDDAPQATTIERCIQEIADYKGDKLPCIFAKYTGEFAIEWFTEEELEKMRARAALGGSDA